MLFLQRTVPNALENSQTRQVTPPKFAFEVWEEKLVKTQKNFAVRLLGHLSKSNLDMAAVGGCDDT